MATTGQYQPKKKKSGIVKAFGVGTGTTGVWQIGSGIFATPKRLTRIIKKSKDLTPAQKKGLTEFAKWYRKRHIPIRIATGALGAGLLYAGYRIAKD